MMRDEIFLEPPTVPSSGESRYMTHLWVSRNVEPQEELCQSDLSKPTTIGFKSGGGSLCHQEIKYKIRAALKPLSLREEHTLVQFWSPCVSKRQLTTMDQPFGLGIDNEKLFIYRRDSEQKAFLIDEDHEEENSPPARVFRREMPEWTCDLTNYKTKDFPQKDCAICCNLHGYLALPVFDSTTGLCVGVLELLTSSVLMDVAYEVEQIHGVLKEWNLTSPKTFEVFDGPALNVFNELRQNELDEIYYILKLICDTHALPLAQTWVVSPSTSYFTHEEVIKKSCSSFNTRCNGKACMSTTLPCYARDLLTSFMQVSKTRHLEKSRGVVGRALLSRGSCYCQDVTELSEEEYPLVRDACKSGLTSCFAIFLRSVEGNNEYVLEFFLPLEEGNNRHVLNLVQTLKQRIEAASRFELGDVSSIEIVNPPTDMAIDRVDSSDLESVVTDPFEIAYANFADQWPSASTNVSTEMICDNFTDSVEQSNILMVNVTFSESRELFRFTRFDGLSNLENEVAKRFNSDGQGLRLKYVDEEGDLIVICHDDDLNSALDTLVSKNVIKLIYGEASF